MSQRFIPFIEIVEKCPAAGCQNTELDPRPPMVHWSDLPLNDGESWDNLRRVYGIFRPCVNHYEAYLRVSSCFRPMGEPCP